MSPDQNTSMSTSSDMITKDFIKEIARTMGNSPSLAVDDDFVNITNKIMASFIEKTAEMTAMLAHHRTNNRNDTKVEPNDVQIALDKLWKIRVPGYLLDPHDVATTRQARKKRRVAGLEKNSAAVVLSHHRKLHTANRSNDQSVMNRQSSRSTSTSQNGLTSRTRSVKRSNQPTD